MDTFDFIVFLSYFGALLIPLVYLLLTRFHGAATPVMLIGVGLQVFWSFAVWALAYFSSSSGAWFYWLLLVPVNILGFVYFATVLIICAFRARGRQLTRLTRR